MTRDTRFPQEKFDGWIAYERRAIQRFQEEGGQHQVDFRLERYTYRCAIVQRRLFDEATGVWQVEPCLKDLPCIPG